MPIQYFMQDLFVCDCNGLVLAGYYAPGKSINYITGTAVRDDGDTYVSTFITGFADHVPVGAEIQVHLSKALGPAGTDFTRQIKTSFNDMFDLEGNNLGKCKYINLQEADGQGAWSKEDVPTHNGTYEITLTYNGQSKKLILVIKA